MTASVAEAGFSPRRTYTAYPTLVELRRYLEPGEKSPTVACVVSIAVTDDKEILIATVRGSATSRGAAAREVLEVATQSAVKRLIKTLASTERSRKRNKPTALLAAPVAIPTAASSSSWPVSSSRPVSLFPPARPG